MMNVSTASPSPTRPDPEPGAFLSIGGAAEATGISSETLRIWERRYGRPRPVRRPSGHRRYTADQVVWLRRIAEALSRGHRPGVVIPMSDAELDQLFAAEPAKETPQRPEIERLMSAVRAYDGELFLRILEASWSALDPIAFLEEIVGPLTETLGREWADGKVDIRHEHYATGITEDFLRVKRAQYVCYPREPRVLLTTLSGELHGLGLQMAGLLCAVGGTFHRVLGVDTPNEQIVKAADETHADVVAISVSLSGGGVETDRVLTDLRRMLPDDVRLCVGGRGARGVRGGPRGIDYVSSLREWSDWLGTLRVAVT